MDITTFILPASNIYLFAIVLSFSVGYNILAKVGTIIVIIGLLAVFSCEIVTHIYHPFNLESPESILKNFSLYHYQIICDVCIWTITGPAKCKCCILETDAQNTLAALASYFSEPDKNEVPTVQNLVESDCFSKQF